MHNYDIIVDIKCDDIMPYEDDNMDIIKYSFSIKFVIDNESMASIVLEGKIIPKIINGYHYINNKLLFNCHKNCSNEMFLDIVKYFYSNKNIYNNAYKKFKSSNNVHQYFVNTETYELTFDDFSNDFIKFIRFIDNKVKGIKNNNFNFNYKYIFTDEYP
jgi:hypothetical protein